MQQRLNDWSSRCCHLEVMKISANHLLIVRKYLISALFWNVALSPWITPSHTSANDIKLYDFLSHADFTASARFRKGLGGDGKGQGGR